MKEPQMKQIAGFINRVLSGPNDETVIQQVHKEVKKLAAEFPLYPAPAGASR